MAAAEQADVTSRRQLGLTVSIEHAYEDEITRAARRAEAARVQADRELMILASSLPNATAATSAAIAAARQHRAAAWLPAQAQA